MLHPIRKRRERALQRMFETRSEAWAAVGLQVGPDAADVRAARRRLGITVPLLIAAIVAKTLAIDHINDLYHRPEIHHHHQHWLVGKETVTVAAAIAVLVLGWLISRDIARLVPTLFRRMDPGTAGTVEFVIRFLAVAATLLAALAVAQVSLTALAVGGGFTAVVVGLAAQQTLGNLFAGMVLLSAQPFRLGERIRLQAGAMGGQLEGTVSSLGLLYTTLTRGQNRIMVPNTQVIAAVVMPVREPTPVDVRVKLPRGMRPSHIQELLDSEVSDAARYTPSIVLEEIDGESVTVRVRATPDDAADSALLADQIIAALTGISQEQEAETRLAGGPD